MRRRRKGVALQVLRSLSWGKQKYNGVFKYSKKRLACLDYMENIVLNRRSQNVEIAEELELSRSVRQLLYASTKELWRMQERGQGFFLALRLKRILDECESILFS